LESASKCAGQRSGRFGGGLPIVPCCSPPRYTDVDAVGFSLLAVSAFGLATVINYAASA